MDSFKFFIASALTALISPILYYTPKEVWAITMNIGIIGIVFVMLYLIGEDIFDGEYA